MNRAITDIVPTFPADVVIADADMSQQDAPNAVPISMQVEYPAPLDPTPATLAAGVRCAILAIEQPGVDVKTGEIKARMACANPDLVRGWITAQWPDLDTTEVEEIYPQVRKALQGSVNLSSGEIVWYHRRHDTNRFITHLHALSLSCRDYQPRGMALLSVFPQLSRCGRTDGRTWGSSLLRDGSTVVPHIRSTLCQPVTPTSRSDHSQMASG